MRHHHEGRAALTRELQHLLEHTIGCGTVQVAGGFIGQHAGGTGHQGARDRDALSLAAREFSGSMPQALAQTHCLQCLAGARMARLDRIAADPQRHRHVVQRAELGQQVMKLINKTQVLIAQAPLLPSAQARELLAHEEHLALRGRVQPSEQVQQGALARTRGSDDGDGLARLHRQVDATQHLDIQTAF